MIISLRKDHMVVVYNFNGDSVEEIKGAIPATFPLSDEAHCKIVTVFLQSE